MSANTDLVTDFCAAWSRLDPSELASYFTEDAVYHNIPAAPVTGRAAIEEFIRSFAGDWSNTVFEILNLAEDGNVVFAERVDRTVARGNKVDLPVTGVFEIKDGKIAAWRDYFDLQTYMNAMS